MVADLARPESLGGALKGAERAFLVSPMQPDLNVLEKNFIDHCKSAAFARLSLHMLSDIVIYIYIYIY